MNDETRTEELGDTDTDTDADTDVDADKLWDRKSIRRLIKKAARAFEAEEGGGIDDEDELFDLSLAVRAVGTDIMGAGNAIERGLKSIAAALKERR